MKKALILLILVTFIFFSVKEGFSKNKKERRRERRRERRERRRERREIRDRNLNRRYNDYRHGFMNYYNPVSFPDLRTGCTWVKICDDGWHSYY